MKIWKWLGWDTRGDRTERLRDSNRHSTLQWGMTCVAALAALVIVIIYLLA